MSPKRPPVLNYKPALYFRVYYWKSLILPSDRTLRPISQMRFHIKFGFEVTEKTDIYDFIIAPRRPHLIFAYLRILFMPFVKSVHILVPFPGWENVVSQVNDFLKDYPSVLFATSFESAVDCRHSLKMILPRLDILRCPGEALKYVNAPSLVKLHVDGEGYLLPMFKMTVKHVCFPLHMLVEGGWEENKTVETLSTTHSDLLNNLSLNISFEIQRWFPNLKRIFIHEQFCRTLQIRDLTENKFKKKYASQIERLVNTIRRAQLTVDAWIIVGLDDPLDSFQYVRMFEALFLQEVRRNGASKTADGGYRIGSGIVKFAFQSDSDDSVVCVLPRLTFTLN